MKRLTEFRRYEAKIRDLKFSFEAPIDSPYSIEVAGIVVNITKDGIFVSGQDADYIFINVKEIFWQLVGSNQ